MSLRCFVILAALAAASPAFAQPAAVPPQTVAAQGVTYAIPGGWRLDRYRFDKAAVLKHDATGAQLLVMRPAKARAPTALTHTERLGNGRTLQWGYATESMDGRVVAGLVEIRMTIMTADLSRVPASLGVPAMRRVAETLAVTGPLEPAAPPAAAGPPGSRPPSS